MQPRKLFQQFTRAILARSSGTPAVAGSHQAAFSGKPKIPNLTAFLLMVGVVIGPCFVAAPAKAQTAMQTYVEAMQPGVNYGNTYDAAPNETSWGNAAITQAYADAMFAKGYRSIRMTVTWRDHIGPAPTYTVDPAWMAKIQQAVDISLNAGLYVVLNAHHDSGWVSDYGWDPVGVKVRFDALWLQIATQFKDYPDTLSFESINEPGFRGTDGKDLPDAEMAIRLDELNTNFVQLVRASGGGNATRPLVLPTVYTRGDQPMLDSLKNTITSLNDPNLIATIHYYGWYPFSVNLGGDYRFDDTSIYWVHKPFDDTYNTFVADGIPVIVGEFSVLSGKWIQRGEQLKYHEYVQAYGRSKGMTMMLWDTGGISSRTTGDWRDGNRDLGEIMMQAVVGRAITAESDLLFIDAAAPVGDTIVDMHLNGNTLVAVEDNGTILAPMTDYTVSGDTLTLKAHVLAKYAMGGYGEKATLKLHADSGPAWKIFVRYAGTPVPAAAEAFTGFEAKIPVAFNGDLLATMESKYADGSNAGPVSWTSFQQFGEAFHPDYANNTIVLNKDFLKGASIGSVVNLSFHFWSGKILKYQLVITESTSDGGTEFQIYGDSFAAGWTGTGAWGGWGANENLASTAQVHSGATSISTSPVGWGGLVLKDNGTTNTSAYRTLVFWIHGGATGGQNLGFGVVPNGDWGIPTNWVNIKPVANTWQKIEIPLSSLGVEGRSDINYLQFSDWSGSGAKTFYLDEIKFTTASTADIYGTPAPIITSTTGAAGMVDSPFSYTITAINNPDTFSATGLPAGLAVDAATGVISGSPLEAGWHFITLGATNEAGTNTETLKLHVVPAPVEFKLPGGGSFSAALMAPYDGGSHAFAVETNPPGLPVVVTYNGSTELPALPGTYHVVVTSADPNYIGSVEGTLVITVTALVRHAPALNGDLDGSLQLLTGESFAVNGSGSVSGDLLVPGTPGVTLNGSPTFVGVVDAAGAAAPADYSVTLNSGAVVRYVVRRVDPLMMPTVPAPAAPVGTRDVTLNNANQSVGSFSTVRNLTLNGNVGAVAVPAGAYGSFTVNGNGSLVLGVAGAEEPALYELQSLTLNGSNASVQIVGPVQLKLARSLTLNGTLGEAEHPEWLELLIHDGGLTLNGEATVHGIVTAPNGAVIVNGTLHGRVSADRLTINGSGVLADPAGL